MVTGNIKFSSTRKISCIYGNLHVFSKLHGLHDTCIMYVRYHTLPFIFLSSFFVQYFFYYRNLIFKRNPLCQSFIHSLKSQDFCFVRKLLSCIVNDLKVPKRQHWKTVQAHGVCKFDNASKVSYFPIWLFPNEIDFHSQNYHWVKGVTCHWRH